MAWLFMDAISKGYLLSVLVPFIMAHFWSVKVLLNIPCCIYKKLKVLILEYIQKGKTV